MNIASLTTFLCRCPVINIVILAPSTLMLVLMRDHVVRIHSELFRVNPETLPITWHQYLGNY